MTSTSLTSLEGCLYCLVKCSVRIRVMTNVSCVTFT